MRSKCPTSDTAVQVEPIKPMLKAPGYERSKLKYDEPPSNFAFNFNLSRYNLVRFRDCTALGAGRRGADGNGRCDGSKPAREEGPGRVEHHLRARPAAVDAGGRRLVGAGERGGGLHSRMLNDK